MRQINFYGFKQLEFEGCILQSSDNNANSKFQQSYQISVPRVIIGAVATAILISSVSGSSNGYFFAQKKLEQPKHSDAINPINQTLGFEAKDHVEFIRNTLGISLVSVADILNVSRTSVYNWLSGEQTIQKSSEQALFRLRNRVELWHQISPHPPGVFLKSRFYDGRNLQDWLKADEVDDNFLKGVMKDIFIHVARQVERMSRMKPSTVSGKDSILDSLSEV
jgi:DNA-binding transcriptional regulator YiaG